MALTDKYLNPLTDFGFKKLFASPFSKELLIDLLNGILLGEQEIKDLTYLNSEHTAKTPFERKALFDLYCENERGEKFIIEIQNVKQAYFKDRSLYYATFPIQAQAQRGQEWNYKLNAIYLIGILNFAFEDEKGLERYRRQIQLIDKDTHSIFYEKLTLIYLEIPRFKKKAEELANQFEKWMYVLRHLHELQERPVALQERIFDRLFREAQIGQLNPKEMEEYEKSLKEYWDQYAIRETAKEEGREEGRKEEKEAIARQLKEEGLSLEFIVKTTGLSAEEVEKL